MWITGRIFLFFLLTLQKKGGCGLVRGLCSWSALLVTGCFQYITEPCFGSSQCTTVRHSPAAPSGSLRVHFQAETLQRLRLTSCQLAGRTVASLPITSVYKWHAAARPIFLLPGRLTATRRSRRRWATREKARCSYFFFYDWKRETKNMQHESVFFNPPRNLVLPPPTSPGRLLLPSVWRIRTWGAPSTSSL